MVWKIEKKAMFYSVKRDVLILAPTLYVKKHCKFSILTVCYFTKCNIMRKALVKGLNKIS